MIDTASSFLVGHVDMMSLLFAIVYGLLRTAETRKKLLSRSTGLSIANGIAIFPLKAYPSASGATKCCSRRGGFVIEQRTNIMAWDAADDRLSPLPDRVPAALSG